MALTPIKKIYFVFLPGDRDRLLKLLQKTATVQIIPGEAAGGSSKTIELTSRIAATLQEQMRQVESRLSQLEWIIEHLQKYQKKTHFIEHFAQPRQFISEQTLEEASHFDLETFVEKFKELDEQNHQVQKALRKNNYLLKRLQLLKDWPEKLNLIQDTPHTFSRLLIVGEHDRDSLEESLSTLLGELSHIEMLNDRGNLRVVLIIGWKDKRIEFEKWVENHPVEMLHLYHLSGTAAAVIAKLESRNHDLIVRMRELENKLQHFTESLPNLQIAYDYWNSERERLERTADLIPLQFSQILVGWIQEKDVPVLEHLIKETKLSVGWQIAEPEPQENPPVDYENPPLIQPFEFVTDLYSRPKYWEMDPTPFLSAFFALFFGICLTDAGYGLILTLLTGIGLKKLPIITPNSRKLLKILFYSGVVTTIVGVFTGGIFGLTPTQLPGVMRWLQHLVLLNPLTNQMGFLIFSLTLGILHVGLGIFLKFHNNLRAHQKGEAWFDQAPWLAILLGVVVLAVASRVNADWLSTTGYLLMGGAALVILLFAGRNSKNPLLRFAQGLYSLYQVSGLLGDILSYARLFALGLATGVIAGVVNFLANMTLGIPYLGYLIMPLVLVGGHLMNLVINALGGFIHTSRLQYVEFFGKFYEGGGEPFEPLQLQLKYTKIKDQRLP